MLASGRFIGEAVSGVVACISENSPVKVVPEKEEMLLMLSAATMKLFLENKAVPLILTGIREPNPSISLSIL